MKSELRLPTPVSLSAVPLTKARVTMETHQVTRSLPALQHHCLQAALAHKTCYQPRRGASLYTVWEVSFATFYLYQLLALICLFEKSDHNKKITLMDTQSFFRNMFLEIASLTTNNFFSHRQNHSNTNRDLFPDLFNTKYIENTISRKYLIYRVK